MKPQRKSEIFDLPSGTMLGGKYELLRKLATGGMAEIYLARTRGTAGFEKLVVVKRILPSVANDPSFVQMFLAEARLAATLRHPNIADVYEVGEEDGAPFFAMEFIHGQDVRGIRFAARAQKEVVPLAVALAITHGIASALDYAHAVTGGDGKPLNLVHRDVSASNILVSYEGAIKLIDFGIARAQGVTQQTQVGTLKGKIPYMSPEQCRGQRLDRRSDLFSLGVCMYELTVGQRPFNGENDFVIMDKIVHQGARPPSELIRNYPAELERMVMKLLAPKPEDRYQSADEVLHELDPYIAQHRLYLSAKALSRYMRTQFADKLAGIEEDATPDAVTRHILNTITNDSQRSQLLTPPSSFPAVMPASQEMAALGVPVSEPFVKPSISEVIPAPTGAIVYPQLKPRSGRWLFALLALVAIGGGGYAGFAYMRSSGDTAPAATTPSQLVAPAGSSPSEPAQAPPEEPQAGTVQPGDTAPQPADPTAQAGTVPEDTAQAGTAPAEAQLDGAEAPKPEEAKPEEAKPEEPKPATKPKITRKRPPPVKKPPPVKDTKPAPPKPAEPKPPDRPKDPTWDKDDTDSPFLP